MTKLILLFILVCLAILLVNHKGQGEDGPVDKVGR